jgi:hypothetical protein
VEPVDWPTATLLIAVVAGIALVLVATLRVLGQVLVSRTTGKEKAKELITEASHALRAEVENMRKELELPEK